jgi:nickel transport protein
MKSLVRWSAALGLAGTTLLGSFVTENLKALALPEAQVMEKLQPVPVFTVTDPQGAPLVASVPDDQNKTQSVAGVFISRKDAQAFVDRLKKDKPDLAQNVQVVPVSLAQIYKLKQENQNKPDGLNFAFIPAQQQVQAAQTLMGQSGQQQQQFQGTPLFVARGGKDNGYLTVQENGQPIIPFFFDKEQLQGMVERFKQQKPDLASTVRVEAVSLEGVLYTLQTSNNKELNNIVIVPSQEALSFLRTLPASGGQPQNAPQGQQQPR